MTSVTYTASASQTVFPFAFPFLSVSHVKVTVDGVAASTSDYTIESGKMTWTGAAFAGGESVFVYRDTPVLGVNRLVDFAGGAKLSETDLDTAFLQLHYALEELRDRMARDETVLSATDPLDANGRRITQVGDPTDAKDAVHKQYADNIVAGAGNLPAVGAGDNDSGIAVVSGAWAVQTAQQLRDLWSLYTKAEQDDRYLRIAQAFSDLVDVQAARGVLQTEPRAYGLFTPAMNNPGVTTLVVDPGGNWWETAPPKIDLSGGASHLRNNEHKRYASSVSRTSGTPNTDDFVGLLENGTVQISNVVPGSVSGTWQGVSDSSERSFTDDGAGNITGTDLDAASSINYETGEITLRASGAENVLDSSVKASFSVEMLRFNASDQAEDRVCLRDGWWMARVSLALQNATAGARTVKAALTDDVSSASTNVIRHLWRTNSRPLDLKASAQAGWMYEWTFEVRSTAERPYVCLRAVADQAAAADMDAVQLSFDYLAV